MQRVAVRFAKTVDLHAAGKGQMALDKEQVSGGVF
jgi:hypothetical protein